MVRTQIQLTDEQVAQLKKLASARHVSMAEIIRQAIDSVVKTGGFPDRNEQTRRAIEAAGKFRSGTKDLSRRHDKYLAEAFGK